MTGVQTNSAQPPKVQLWLVVQQFGCHRAIFVLLKVFTMKNSFTLACFCETSLGQTFLSSFPSAFLFANCCITTKLCRSQLCEPALPCMREKLPQSTINCCIAISKPRHPIGGMVCSCCSVHSTCHNGKSGTNCHSTFWKLRHHLAEVLLAL